MIFIKIIIPVIVFCVNLYCVSALPQVLRIYYLIQNSLHIGARGTHIIINYLNNIVWTYCFQFGLFTLSLLLHKI